MTSIIKVNEIQDAGGNTILSSNGTGTFTSNLPSAVNTPAFEAYISADQSVSDNTFTKAQFNTEVFDIGSCYDNTTNYRFTPNVAGKYFVYTSLDLYSGNVNDFNFGRVHIRLNGTTDIILGKLDHRTNATGYGSAVKAIGSVVMNGTTDYLEVYGNIDSVTSGGEAFTGNGTLRLSTFGAYKIIE
jgi:hypothetical protein